MKDELKHVASVDNQSLARTVSKRIYARFGVRVRWSDSSHSKKYSVDLIDDGTLNREQVAVITGYTIGILEFLEPLFSYA